MEQNRKISLEVFRILCWRRMEKISWMERVTSKDILTQVGELRCIVKYLNKTTVGYDNDGTFYTRMKNRTSQ